MPKKWGDTMATTTTKSGKSETKITNDFDDFLKQIAFELVPQIEKDIEVEIEEIYDNAKKNWLVRKKRSQRSIDKLKFGVNVKGTVVTAFVVNLAPYAWAIKVGTSSDSNLKPGKKLADILLWQPAKKLSKKLTKKLADGIVELARKK
jgi:hypothetical protein